MKTILILSCLTVAVFGQGGDYACDGAGNGINDPAYTRGDLLGVDYFCTTDRDNSGTIELSEPLAFNNEWSGGSGASTHDQFVAGLTSIIDVCDNEASLAFQSEAGHDGDGSSVSADDVTIWFQSFGEDPIGPARFRTIWIESYNRIQAAGGCGLA